MKRRKPNERINNFLGHLVIQEIDNKITKHFLSIEEYMLTGSTIENRCHKNSDIDILALSKALNRIVIETFIDKNICYQFILLPYYKASVLLYSDYLKGNTVYRSMIEKGIILKESSNRQLNQLQRFYKRHPQNQLNDAQLLRLRHKITELLNDINDNNALEDNVFIAMELLRQMALLAIGEPDQSGKHLARKLAIHPQTKVLFDSFIHSVQTNNISTFAAVVEKMLCSRGGQLRKYSSGYVSAIPDKRFLMIQFPNHTIFQSIIRQTIGEIIALFPPKVLWHSFYIGNNQCMERGTYLYVFAEDSDLISMFKERIDRYFKTAIDQFLRQDIRMSYCYQTSFQDGLLWGGRQIHNRLIPLFAKLSCLTEKHMQSKPDKITLFNQTFELIIYLCHQLFRNKEEQIAFLNFYVKCNLCEVIDINGIYPVSLLTSVEQSVIKHYEELYVKQKKSFIPVIKLMYNMDDEKENEYFQIASDFSQILLAILPDDLEFPSFCESDHPIFVLYCSVINHLFASMHLNIQEGFSILYYYRNLNQEL